MAGRGRGRGRGGAKWAPPSEAKKFFLDSAKECGLDPQNRSLKDASMFQDILLHSSGDQRMLSLIDHEKERGGNQDCEKDGAPLETSKKLSGVKRTLQTVFLIEKGVQIHNRIQNSVFYVRPSKNVPDAIRYSDSTRPPPQIDASAVLSSCLEGRKKTALGRFVPEELVSGQIQVETGRLFSSIEAENVGAKDDNLNDFETKERRGQRTGSLDGAEGEEEEEFEQGEEEDGEDYITNYYESEGEESEGGDEEPTF